MTINVINVIEEFNISYAKSKIKKTVNEKPSPSYKDSPNLSPSTYLSSMNPWPSRQVGFTNNKKCRSRQLHFVAPIVAAYYDDDDDD